MTSLYSDGLAEITGIRKTAFINLVVDLKMSILHLLLSEDRIWYRKRLGGAVMNITEDIKPVTYLKNQAADVLKQINETQRPMIITQNGEPKAVLQDTVSYQNMRNAIGLLKLISQGEDDIKQGKVKAQDTVFAELEKRVKENAKEI